MLILGLLAAIAIPAFFNQRDKARDAEAKTSAKTAQTAMETFATDNNGSYATADVDALTDIEPTITGVTLPVAPTADTYTIRGTSSTGNYFEIVRDANGGVAYPCQTPGDGGCPSGAGGWG
jgi:type IV pilus assembly protein PilA